MHNRYRSPRRNRVNAHEESPSKNHLSLLNKSFTYDVQIRAQNWLQPSGFINSLSLSLSVSLTLRVRDEPQMSKRKSTESDKNVSDGDDDNENPQRSCHNDDQRPDRVVSFALQKLGEPDSMNGESAASVIELRQKVAKAQGLPYDSIILSLRGQRLTDQMQLSEWAMTKSDVICWSQFNYSLESPYGSTFEIPFDRCMTPNQIK